MQGLLQGMVLHMFSFQKDLLNQGIIGCRWSFIIAGGSSMADQIGLLYLGVWQRVGDPATWCQKMIGDVLA